LGLVDRHSHLALDLPYLLYDAGALVQQFHQLAINLVDAGPALGQRGPGFLLCHVRAIRNPCFNSRVNDSNWISREALQMFRSIKRMKAEPTTTPSHWAPISATCSGVETPKPTASGRSVTARID